MAIDILIHSLRKDPTVKRHLVKAVTWRVVGTMDTVMLSYVITGDLPTGIRIGAVELLTKILLYFIHERVWKSMSFGQPGIFKRQRNPEQRGSNLYRQEFAVSRKEREKQNGHTAFTCWLTGLSGSGKSSIASAMDKWLHERGIHSFIIDGDNTRMGINSDLNFTREGREENIRRVAELCRLFNEAGMVVISSFISPFAVDRERARDIIGKDSFHEVFISASLDTCIARDTKGLYKKALEGEIRDFTGVNSPYEAPQNPGIRLDTDSTSLDECLQRFQTWLLEQRLTDIDGHTQPYRFVTPTP